MNQLHKTLLLLGFILAASSSGLWAQPYSVDEYGNGTLGSPLAGGPYPMPYQVAPDPTGGITTSPVLIYSLKFPVVAGDVALLAPDSTIAHLLRFYTPAGQSDSVLIFYSQTDPTTRAPAKVGIPSSANPTRISAVSPTTVWYPTGWNQPGSPAGPCPVFDQFRYNINLVPTPPVWSQVSLAGTNLVWKLSQGTPGLPFTVVATTNPTLPLAYWSAVSAGNFDGFGRCTLTLPIEPDKPFRFYTISHSAP